jgi:hypothetical protein
MRKPKYAYANRENIEFKTIGEFHHIDYLTTILPQPVIASMFRKPTHEEITPDGDYGSDMSDYEVLVHPFRIKISIEHNVK